MKITDEPLEEAAQKDAKEYADARIKQFPKLNPDGFRNESITRKEGFLAGAKWSQEHEFTMTLDEAYERGRMEEREIISSLLRSALDQLISKLAEGDANVEGGK